MKVSILISVVILALAGAFAWQGQQRFERVRTEHREVVSQAAALGISADGGPSSVETRNPLARERKERELEARKLAEEVIAFAKRMKEFEEAGEKPDEDLQKQTMQMMKRFLDLDGQQLKSLIGILRESAEIDDEMRNGIVGFSIMMLANESPEAALALFSESSDMLEKEDMSRHVVASALSRWAAKDPFGALDWIRENGKKNPDLVTDRVKAGVVAGAARQDPALALGLIGELGLEETHRAVDGIARSARTPEERMALLRALRDHGAGEDKEAQKLKGRVLGSLGGQMANGGFERSAEWLMSAELSESEMGAVFDGVSYHQTKKETGDWINWAGENVVDEDSMKRKVNNLMSTWTRADFKAAGTWLNEADDGPAKEVAVISYASTVAPYEPATAAQWAMTLPEGGERKKLVEKIHAEWKKKDEPAAAVFAAEQGIE